MKIYRDYIKKYDHKVLQLSKKLKYLSFLRLFIFILSLVPLIYLFSSGFLIPLLVVFPISVFGFGLAIGHYNKTDFLIKHSVFLKTINESEISRGESNLENLDTGQSFINQNHPYSSDLDIFGQHSLFQLLNRTTTESGRILLSEWLSEPASDSEIPVRQKAIKELAGKLDWRQDFQASGMHFQNKKSDYNKLLGWAESPLRLLQKRHFYIALALILSILSILGFYFLSLNLDSQNKFIFYLALLVMVQIINYFILRKLKPIAEDIVETSQKNIDTLKAYRILISKIESENFKSEKLLELKSLLSKNKYSAFREINRLCRILEFSQQRGINRIKVPIKGNFFYHLFNIFLLIDIYLIIGVEKWKSRNKLLLASWSAVVSEFEVMNSLAGFSFSNPSYTFPELTDKNNYIHFDSLGHPLINSNTRVCNDFKSGQPGNITMITGSNMGGKSTFLRAIGVNLVLALAGAPCCANYGQVSNLKLYTSMRTQDNLKQGISSFYAELDRIEKLLKLIHQNDTVFYLLDEMFKGTNSKDRHKGGFSLINQLRKLPASGVIATHDIELAGLAEKKMLVTNFSFNSEIKDNSMIFSYELHPGICNDFNASELMKKSGINIL